MFNLEEIEQLAYQKLVKYRLLDQGWKFKFDRAKKRAGCCHFNKKMISLSKLYCNVAPKEEILNTLLHEIAHALVGFKHHHDVTWSSKALEIGCDAKATNKLSFTQARYNLGCKEGCWDVPRHRINMKWLLRKRCGKCGAKLFVDDYRKA